MEKAAVFLIPLLLGVVLFRLLLLPMKWGLRLGFHAGSGFLCLWLLNTVSGVTGVLLPINLITVLISGTLGLPGVVIVALLQVLG